MIRFGVAMRACVVVLALGQWGAAATGPGDGDRKSDGPSEPASGAARRLSPPPVLHPASVAGQGASVSSVPRGIAEGEGLVREGAFLRDRRGRLVRQEGAWVFVFDADAAGQREPPMFVHPCRRLREMQQAMESRFGTVTFQVSGQVFAYGGSNYLLPTFFSVVSLGPAEAVVEPASAAGGGEGDPGVRELLARMAEPNDHAPRQRVRGGENGSGGDRSPPLREGMMLVSRRGRVIRESGGPATFVMDNGAGQRPQSDSPLIILPCLNLELMESWVQRRGRSSIFRVSGSVFAYEGLNYLLPTFFVVETGTEGNLIPAQ